MNKISHDNMYIFLLFSEKTKLKYICDKINFSTLFSTKRTTSDLRLYLLRFYHQKYKSTVLRNGIPIFDKRQG